MVREGRPKSAEGLNLHEWRRKDRRLLKDDIGKRLCHVDSGKFEIPFSPVVVHADFPRDEAALKRLDENNEFFIRKGGGYLKFWNVFDVHSHLSFSLAT